METVGAGVRRPGAFPDWQALAVLAVAGGVVPLVIAGWFGALDVAHNDSYSYFQILFRFADTGRLDGNGFTAVTLVGQLVAALPLVWVFGHSFTAPIVGTAVLGVVGLYAVHDLALQFLPRRQALFVASATAAVPVWATLAAVYMTDVPSFACTTVCLALGARAVRRDRLGPGLLVAALAVGVVGVSVREVTAVAPAAVVLAACWCWSAWDGRSRKALVVTGVAAAVTGVVVVAWARSLPGWGAGSAALPDGDQLREVAGRIAPSLTFVGLGLVPVVLLAGPVRLLRASWERARVVTAVVGVGAAAGLAAAFVAHRSAYLLLGPGDVVTPTGVGGLAKITVAGAVPRVLPLPVLRLFAVAGAGAAVVLLVALVPAVLDLVARIRDGRRAVPEPPAVTAVVLAALGFTILPTVTDLFLDKLLDRYYLLALPLLAILTLRAAATRTAAVAPPSDPARTVRRATALVALAALFGLGGVLAANRASFDAVRWDLADRMAARFGTSNVDGGFEWSNWHAGRQVWLGADGDRLDRCVVLRAEADPSGAVLGAQQVWSPTGGPWIVARRVRDC